MPVLIYRWVIYNIVSLSWWPSDVGLCVLVHMLYILHTFYFLFVLVMESAHFSLVVL